MEDDSFEVLLAADHDFDLFKNLRMNPTQEIWVQPVLEDTEAAVRRLLPAKTEINKNDL